MCSETSEAVGTNWEHAQLEIQKFLKIRITLVCRIKWWGTYTLRMRLSWLHMIWLFTINRRSSKFLVLKKLLSSSGISLPSAWRLMFDLSRCPSWGHGPFSIVVKGTGERPRGELEIKANLLVDECLDKGQALFCQRWIVISTHLGLSCRHFSCVEQEGL